MLEFLKNAVSNAVEALTQNGEHRASLASALTVAHDTIVSLESRIAAIEAKIEAGFTAAGTVAAVVDAVTGAGAPVQVETKPVQ